MKNDKNIENMLRNAVSHAAPDARDAILSACDHEKGKVIYMEKKRSSPLRGFAAVAAVLVLIIAGVFAVKNLGAPSDTLAAVVSLSYNAFFLHQKSTPADHKQDNLRKGSQRRRTEGARRYGT